jgi:hypothetical protein
MALKTNNGVIFFPSGVGLPTLQMGNRMSKGYPQFQALLDSIASCTASSPNASFSMQVAEAVLKVLNDAGTTPYQFFVFNLNDNPNIDVVAKGFLEDTLGLLNISNRNVTVNDYRQVSAKLFSEVVAMPLSSSIHMTKINKATRIRRLQYDYPKESDVELIAHWSSLDGGVMDMLWTFRALFGHGE